MKLDTSASELVKRAKELNSKICDTQLADDFVAQIAETPFDSVVCVNGEYVTKDFIENHLAVVENNQRSYSMVGKGRVIVEELRGIND